MFIFTDIAHQHIHEKIVQPPSVAVGYLPAQKLLFHKVYAQQPCALLRALGMRLDIGDAVVFHRYACAAGIAQTVIVHNGYIRAGINVSLLQGFKAGVIKDIAVGNEHIFCF